MRGRSGTLLFRGGTATKRPNPGNRKGPDRFSRILFCKKVIPREPCRRNASGHPRVLRETGQRVQADVKGTASILAEKFGIPAAVLERSEARTHYTSLLPITPAIVAEQQEVADTFVRLGIIPKAIRVSEDVSQRTGFWPMKVFWFILNHGDVRYLGTAERASRTLRASLFRPEGKGAGATHARSVIAIQTQTGGVNVFD